VAPRRARLVEYGSSFAAIRAAGTRRSILDAIFNMNEQHLGRDAVTVYEALEEAGLTTAAVNITCYRGRRRTCRWSGLHAAGLRPEQFFFYSLFESDVTALRSRCSAARPARSTPTPRTSAAGSSRATPSTCSCTTSRTTTSPRTRSARRSREALARSDAAVGALIEAAGGPDEFLDRYAVVVCSDHGQTPVDRAVSLEARSRATTGCPRDGSNRAGMVYRLAELPRGRRPSSRGGSTAHRRPRSCSTARADEAVARRGGEELRFAPADDGWRRAATARC
jgi:hypothetical protein